MYHTYAFFNDLCYKVQIYIYIYILIDILFIFYCSTTNLFSYYWTNHFHYSNLFFFYLKYTNIKYYIFLTNYFFFFTNHTKELLELY